jgi:chromosome segregation ATPase
MNPEQQPQARAKPCEDTMQELDAALRALNSQIAKLEKRIRIAMEQVNTVDVSTP